jgi:GT2 family glycosyltransferase
LRLKGERCLQVGEAVVHHVGSASAGRGTAFTAYHLARNQIWTFVKNMPAPLFWPLLPGHVAWQAAVLCRSLPLGTAVSVAKGVADALKGLPAIWKARRQVQEGRTVSSWQIARALTWSPRKLWARASDLKTSKGEADRH